jgi:hypothetical protein
VVAVISKIIFPMKNLLQTYQAYKKYPFCYAQMSYRVEQKTKNRIFVENKQQKLNFRVGRK